MQSVVLVTLLDLCDNPKTLAHVETWRGEKELTAPVLLLQLWRKEEAETRVKRDQHGRITGIYAGILVCCTVYEGATQSFHPFVTNLSQ